MTVPVKHLTKILPLLTGDRTTLIKEEDTYASFALEQPGLKVICRVIEGQYPNAAQLIPKQFGLEFTFDRKALLSDVEYIMVFASQKNDILQFDLSGKTIVVQAEAQEVGDGKAPTDAVIDDAARQHIDQWKAAHAVAFNGKYLLDALKVSGSEKVTLKGNTPTSPWVLHFSNDDKFTYLVMPVQIRS